MFIICTNFFTYDPEPFSLIPFKAATVLLTDQDSHKFTMDFARKQLEKYGWSEGKYKYVRLRQFSDQNDFTTLG